jgi:hypothetical protein
VKNLSMLLLLAAICAAAVVWNRGTWQAPAQPVAAPAPAANSVAPAPSKAVIRSTVPTGPKAGPTGAMSKLSFESTPPGAEVVGPKGSMGTTPFSVNVQASERPESVLYRLDGHFTQQRKVPLTEAVVTAKMTPR